MKQEEDKNQGRNKKRIAPIIINMSKCTGTITENNGKFGFTFLNNKKKRKRKINIFLDGKKVISDHFSFQGYCCVSIDNERNRVYIETKEYLEGDLK